LVKKEPHLGIHRCVVTTLVGGEIAPRYGQICVDTPYGVGERLTWLKLVTYEQRNSPWISVIERAHQELVNDNGRGAAIDCGGTIVENNADRSCD
jgi:hypothetical protein